MVKNLCSFWSSVFNNVLAALAALPCMRSQWRKITRSFSYTLKACKFTKLNFVL